MKISIISYAFHRLMRAGTIDLFGYLESCRYRYGLSAADLWNGMLVSLEDDYIAKVREGLAERELTLANLAVDGAHIWEDDPALREEHHRLALRHLEVAEALGAQTVRIDAGSRRERWTEAEFAHLVARYREYAQRAYDGGYRVGPENHWGPELDATQLRALYDAVDHPGFGVLLHFKAWAGPDAERGDELIVPCAMHCHLWPVLGEALPAKMAALRDAGYQGTYGAEMVADSYAEVGVLLARIRCVLDSWRR